MGESENTYRQAVERDPHEASAYYQRVQLAQDPSRLEEAEAAYRKAIALEPMNAGYVYRLGLLLHEALPRPAEAEAAYRRAIALAPDDPLFCGGLINLLVQQSRQVEVTPFSERMRVMRGAAENWYGLATLDAILGNPEDALAHLRRAAADERFNRDWARKDPDLPSLRNDPRFDEIVGRR